MHKSYNARISMITQIIIYDYLRIQDLIALSCSKARSDSSDIESMQVARSLYIYLCTKLRLSSKFFPRTYWIGV